MREHRSARLMTLPPSVGHDARGEAASIADRYEGADCAVAGEAAERGDVADDGREPAGERLEQSVAAAFTVAAEHEHVACAAEGFYVRVRHAAEQVDVCCKALVLAQQALHRGKQLGRAERTP